MSSSVTPAADAATAATKFIDARACAARYSCSWRHWLRLVDAGRAPRPIRFGRLVRWSVADLDRWESDGCPRCHGRAGR